MTVEVGTTIPRREIGMEHAGHTLRCTAYAEWNPRRPTAMNIGCQHFTLENLLANGGTAEQYEPDYSRVRVTFTGTVNRNGYMRVPFHDAEQSLGNINEYVQSAVVVEAPPNQIVRAARPRIYWCEAHPTEHMFIVEGNRDGEAVIARANIGGGNRDFLVGSTTMWIDHPECRPTIGPPVNQMFPNTTQRHMHPQLRALVTADQLTGNDRL